MDDTNAEPAAEEQRLRPLQRDDNGDAAASATPTSTEASSSSTQSQPQPMPIRLSRPDPPTQRKLGSTTTTTSTSATTPSSSSLSRTPAPPAMPHSADSFLRHLHNDPEAAHLSLSGSGMHAKVVATGMHSADDQDGSNEISTSGAPPAAPLGLMGKPLDVFPTAPPVGKVAGDKSPRPARRRQSAGAGSASGASVASTVTAIEAGSRSTGSTPQQQGVPPRPSMSIGGLRSSGHGRLRTHSGGARVTTRPTTAPSPAAGSSRGNLPSMPLSTTAGPGSLAVDATATAADAPNTPDGDALLDPMDRRQMARNFEDGANGYGSTLSPNLGNEGDDDIWPALPSPTEVEASPHPDLIAAGSNFSGSRNTAGSSSSGGPSRGMSDPIRPGGNLGVGGGGGPEPISSLFSATDRPTQLVDTPDAFFERRGSLGGGLSLGGGGGGSGGTTGSSDSCLDALSVKLSEMMDSERSRGGSAGPSRSSSTGPNKERKVGNTTVIGSAGSFANDGTNSPNAPLSGIMAPTSQTFPVPNPGQSALPHFNTDWSQFIQAYSEGRFDPVRIPNPPRSLAGGQPMYVSTSNPSSSAVGRASDRLGLTGTTAFTSQPTSSGSGSSEAKTADSLTTGISNETSSTLPSTVASLQPTGERISPLPSPGKRVSLPELPKVSANDSNIKRQPPGHIDFSSSAAAIRLASSGYVSSDFTPLSVPSPERELLDPMASAGSSSKSRIGSSASDTSADIGARPGSWPSEQRSALGLPTQRLDTIPASPLGTPADESPLNVSDDAATLAYSERRMASLAPHRANIPPASAPIEWQNDKVAGTSDYFGDAGKSHSPDSKPPPASRTSSSMTITGRENDDDHTSSSSSRRGSFVKPKLVAHGSHEVAPTKDAAAPTPRSVFISREAPAAMGLPAALFDRPINNPAAEEEAFRSLGYLRAPLPPNEIERRRALYKFNILHTPQDVNFDRIAHLAKLVFSAKIVMIALVDEKDQWHKVEFGLGAASADRVNSFCGHSILARTDEPLVVLDAQLDWRFANNPNVVGPPHIRFYAGAPLRTSDGHNIGSLCLIDTQPRPEFPPRSRLALKEFAAIAVREMELWREKTRLKARDKIQTSMEQFTRECLELDNAADLSPANAAAKMEQVYERAAKLVRKTLEVDGALVLDLSQFESVEITTEDDTVETIFQADAYDVGTMAEAEEYVTFKQDNSWVERKIAFSALPPWAVMGAAEKSPPPADRPKPGTSADHAKFSEFLKHNPEGKIYEGVVPSWIRHALPPGIQYVMLVPIFNIDKHPFALLCAYISNSTRRFLEGYELQFLRAIGVIILSAVLKRRMVLADKAKSNFISNISHELRTPLHGILAAAELLSDTPLDSNQVAFLQTVQACGNSLIETVNHVLDFTKLSGSAKHNVENVIRPGSVDLSRLVEETVEGCWIGQRARSYQGQSGIGSFYSPPAANLVANDQRPSIAQQLRHVETVIDIGQREQGWHVRCEKGGIRRVLMNLIGNSLKFTTDGYIQVTLRELPHTPGARSIPIEMAVIDTGKGISKQFLKEQLFHPFSQENPLQTGTGLGLAIVNSIVRSESVNGKVDVWSSEGLGTEIKVTLNVDVDDSDETESNKSAGSSRASMFGTNRTISLVGFNNGHRGARLSAELIANYAAYWGFNVSEDENAGSIVIVNEDGERFLDAQTIARPVLIATSNRASRPTAASAAYTRAGGFVQLVFKPIGPSRLESGLRACIRALEQPTPGEVTSRSSRSEYFGSSDTTGSPAEEHSRVGTPFLVDTPTSNAPTSRHFANLQSDTPGLLLRRRSEEERPLRRSLQRPSMAPRSTTAYEGLHSRPASTPSHHESEEENISTPGSPTSQISTISLADGGVMLKIAAAPVEVRKERKANVLLVDDNNINLNLLGAYLRKRGMHFQTAENGQICVDQFSSDPSGSWDIILMDISMPVLDGFGATRAIRRIEAERRRSSVKSDSSASTSSAIQQVVQKRTKIFALSGRATVDDKKQAFSAGVDGYLVKPVKLSSLDALFKSGC